MTAKLIAAGGGWQKRKRVSAALAGQFETHGLPLKRYVRDFRVTEDALLPIGTSITARHFVVGQHVDRRDLRAVQLLEVVPRNTVRFENRPDEVVESGTRRTQHDALAGEVDDVLLRALERQHVHDLIRRGLGGGGSDESDARRAMAPRSTLGPCVFGKRRPARAPGRTGPRRPFENLSSAIGRDSAGSG